MLAKDTSYPGSDKELHYSATAIANVSAFSYTSFLNSKLYRAMKKEPGVTWTRVDCIIAEELRA